MDRRSPFVVRLQRVAFVGKPLHAARRLEKHGFTFVRDDDHPERHVVEGAGITLSVDLRGRVDFVHVQLCRPGECSREASV